jgi:hypothetical protein
MTSEKQHRAFRLLVGFVPFLGASGIFITLSILLLAGFSILLGELL